MSRIGKLPIAIPEGVEVSVQDKTVRVKGPKGDLTRTVSPSINVTVKNGSVLVERANDEKTARQLHGLSRTLINNMVLGVTQGYQKTLDIVGIGYRVAKQGTNISLQVGYSSPVVMVPLKGIQLDVEGQNRIHVKGAEKDAVGQMAARIRKVRPPDLYKGKGIRYAGEVVRLKPGKGGKKA